MAAFVSQMQIHARFVSAATCPRALQPSRSGRFAYIALGSNADGAWGPPENTLATALKMLAQSSVHVKAVSGSFMTRPVGGPWQADFVNAVILAEITTSPAALLRSLNRLERAAGRRPGPHWGPRPLDLDIIDVGGAVAWSARPRQRVGGARRRAGQIQCPHPEMHRRAFVLEPLAEIAPHWYHSVLRRSVRALLSAPGVKVQLKGQRRIGGDGIGWACI
jgi:2-amino-4-hydroxy-6-hydroxymethyldihydropteridine diphosphokinase